MKCSVEATLASDIPLRAMLFYSGVLLFLKLHGGPTTTKLARVGSTNSCETKLCNYLILLQL